MTLRAVVAACVLAATAALGHPSPVVAAPVPTADAAPPSPLSVTLDESEVEAGPGERVRFRSTVRNQGDRPLSDLVAHVAILTSDADVYVDPEDWSPRRTQYVDGLGPGEETRLTWNVQAVTAGPIILYVAVSDPATDSVSVSGPLYMTVTGQRVVDAQNVTPLVAGVPAAILVLVGLTAVRRRSRR